MLNKSNPMKTPKGGNPVMYLYTTTVCVFCNCCINRIAVLGRNVGVNIVLHRVCGVCDNFCYCSSYNVPQYMIFASLRLLMYTSTVDVRDGKVLMSHATPRD